MAVLLALLTLLRASAATRDCPLLADDERAFRVTRVGAEEWEAEVGFMRWEPKALVRILWPRAVEVASVSAAHVVETVANGATIVLDGGNVAIAGGVEGRPGSGSVVLVVKREPGSQPSTPAISCNIGDGLRDEVHMSSLFGLSPPPPPPQERGALQLAHATKDGCVRSATLVASDLRLSSRAVLASGDDGCSALELQLQPALMAPLCEPRDELALEWLVDGAWQRLHDVASDAGWQQAAQAAQAAAVEGVGAGGGASRRDPPLRASAAGALLLHGLSASTVYAFRLRLTRAADDGSFDAPESGAASTFGPSTGETIIDGGSLMSLLGAEPLHAVASSSSSLQMPWQGSACRPHAAYRVAVVRSGDPTLIVPNAEIDLDGGALTLKRTRCPGAGCELRLTPLGLRGLPLPSRTTPRVTTPRLAALPPNGCRLELRFGPGRPRLPADAIEAPLARDVAAAIAAGARARGPSAVEARSMTPGQLRVVEARLQGEYVIFDLLSHRRDSASTQSLCDALAAAMPAAGLCRGAGTHGASGCAAFASSCLGRGEITRHVDLSGGLVQLVGDGAGGGGETEVQMTGWLVVEALMGHVAAGSSEGGDATMRSQGVVSYVPTASGGAAGGADASPLAGAPPSRRSVLAVLVIEALVLLLLPLGAIALARRSKARHGVLRVELMRADVLEMIDDTACGRALLDRLAVRSETRSANDDDDYDDERGAWYGEGGYGGEGTLAAATELGTDGWPCAKQQVELETSAGVRATCEVPLYDHDTLAAVEARLRHHGTKALGPALSGGAADGGRVPIEMGPLSIQYWDAETQKLCVADERTRVSHMRSNVHKWRVLVLGVA